MTLLAPQLVCLPQDLLRLLQALAHLRLRVRTALHPQQELLLSLTVTTFSFAEALSDLSALDPAK